MIRRSEAYWTGVVVMFAMATLIATQPVGVLWHFGHDHIAQHSGETHSSVLIGNEDANTAHHHADHGHMCIIPAAALITPAVARPQPLAVLAIFEEIAQRSLAPFPPFSPPRA